ncbi:hypothetical protein [Cognatishimia sp.]|uniref:hypothetical protein n=1 Tax=Cognatishimia sp. TaxID=2211648 RepID=UPI0035145BDE|nr:hypothetical protein [Cognatishimia sp.]
MKKETFNKLLKLYMNQYKRDLELTKSLELFAEGFHTNFDSSQNLLDVICIACEEALSSDKVDKGFVTDTINWWLFDAPNAIDNDLEVDNDVIFDHSNNKPIPVSNTSELYDYITLTASGFYK